MKSYIVTYNQLIKKYYLFFEKIIFKSKEYKKIEEFLNNTKESYKLTIEDMFKIDREGEKERFRADIDNHIFLWHGSRLSNFVGILSQGLRIAPPEAPVSGYRLGKGIYLADMISKSTPYCCANTSGGTFCIMVCEAACGTFNEKLHDDFYASNLPQGTHWYAFFIFFIDYLVLKLWVVHALHLTRMKR